MWGALFLKSRFTGSGISGQLSAVQPQPELQYGPQIEAQPRLL
jgi:hypothetical protein